MSRIAKCLLYECVWGLVSQKGGLTLNGPISLSTSTYNNGRDQKTSDQGAASREIRRIARVISLTISTSWHRAPCTLWTTAVASIVSEPRLTPGSRARWCGRGGPQDPAFTVSRFPGGRLQPPVWLCFSSDRLSFPQCLLCARSTHLKCEG